MASRAQAAGFTCVKVKVGMGDDVGRVAAVREAAPDIEIRLDANGAWTPGQAITLLDELAALRIECCEEPVHGTEGLSRVAESVSVPIAADETRVLDSRICTAVCLKISSSGGITGLCRDADRARRTGYEVYLASALDGPLGIAGALHAAAVVRPDRACGLATLERFVAPDPLPPTSGAISAPSTPGLGLSPMIATLDGGYSLTT
jgi:L-alanine-DL-glutamate epimerase-like enolase superfamily enzyme